MNFKNKIKTVKLIYVSFFLRIFYNQLSSSLPAVEHLETELTSLRISNLNPNTQYSLYATAVSTNNGSILESEPSETLHAWTDPAFPAFVEVNNIFFLLTLIVPFFLIITVILALSPPASIPATSFLLHFNQRCQLSCGKILCPMQELVLDIPCSHSSCPYREILCFPLEPELNPPLFLIQKDYFLCKYSYLLPLLFTSFL